MTVKAPKSRFGHFAAVFASTAIVMLTATAPSHADTLTIVGFGDSLMEGYQLPSSAAFPVQLEEALREKGYDVEIVNAGLSGDTTSGGLSRLDWSVQEGTDGVILELGANDALRGLTPQSTEENLRAIIERLRERNIPVLLAGMLAPPNMGTAYAEDFNGTYQDLADDYDLPLYPFFLDGVAGQPNLNLDDGMHPNEEGVSVMVERFLPIMEKFLVELGAQPSGSEASN